MLTKNIGILGTGLWEGEPVDNEQFAEKALREAEVKDPYRGRRGDDGSIRVAGMEFTPQRYPRTIAAIERGFRDPFRGTRRRRIFPPDLKASDAEAEAGRNAIRDAGLSPKDIGAVLVHSFLPDEVNPKNSALVAHKLGIRNAPAWEVDSICNSALAHISVGASLISSGFARHVLCVQSAAYSRVSDRGVSASIQEADLASAFVLGRSEGSAIANAWHTDGAFHGAVRLEWSTPTAAAPRRWWERSQESLLIRFDPKLQERVMAEIEVNAKRVCDEALRQAEMSYDELDVFIPHQGMNWNRAFMEDVLGLRDGVAFDTFEEYANVNSPGMTASLHEARRLGRIERGSRVLMFAPAAGYTYGAAAFRW